MPVLANSKLKDAIASGQIQVTPPPHDIQPASIDLTVGEEAFVASADEVTKL